MPAAYSAVSLHSLPSDLWIVLESWLPPTPAHPKGGRPRRGDRQCMEGILYILLAGVPWRLLPPQFGPPSTVFDRFQQWSDAGVFERLWEQALLTYDEEAGIPWTWQAMDGALTKAPLGGEGTGPNPTDRAKSGGKRSLLTDGNGIPLAVVLAPANRHDVKLFEATLEARRVLPPLTS